MPDLLKMMTLPNSPTGACIEFISSQTDNLQISPESHCSNHSCARYLRIVVHSHLYNVLHYNVTSVSRKHYWLYHSRMVPGHGKGG